MSKDRIYAAARKLQGMVKRAREFEGNLDDGEAYKAMLADADPAKALEVAKSLADGRVQLEKMIEAVNKETKRQGLAAAEELLTDLTAVLGQAESAYDEWRQAKQRYELDRALDPNNINIQYRNDELAQLHTRYEKALELASDLVPSPGVIQL